MTINVGAAPFAVLTFNNRKPGHLFSCLHQMLDLLFDYRSQYRTNFTDEIKMDGSVDIVFEPLARNYNLSFPNVSISVPFGSTSCFIAHTIPGNVKFIDAFESLSFMSREVSILMLIVTVIGCWILFSSKSRSPSKDFVRTTWLSIQLMINQISDHSQSIARTKKYKSNIFLMLIVSVTLIKLFFGVHFSTQLTVAQPQPTINSLETLLTWDFKKCVQIYSICPSLLTGSSTYPIYESKKEYGGVGFEQMGRAEPGQVISLLATDEILIFKHKMCAYYPVNRLHVSPSFGQTTVSLPVYI